MRIISNLKFKLLPNGNFPFQSAPPDPTFRAGSSRPETLAAQRQLAWVLAGSYRSVIGIDTGITNRYSRDKTHFRKLDVSFLGGYSELKFAGDHVINQELSTDVLVAGRGLKVRYDVVPHPLTGRVTPDRDLRRLKDSCTPFKVWAHDSGACREAKGSRFH